MYTSMLFYMSLCIYMCIHKYLHIYIYIYILLWTPTYARVRAGRPTRTYILQLCEDTGCSSEDLPEAMMDMEKWRECVRDIRAGGTI